MCVLDGGRVSWLFCFFFNDTATTEIYTLSLHDALPISYSSRREALAGFERELPDLVILDIILGDEVDAG